ncbi:hypothetical protein HYU12_00210 [Candidatus Woesearchaeota archaeon]|nr:hypothetical protein [Candidatus Woesearchaeota archaeon]
MINNLLKAGLVLSLLFITSCSSTASLPPIYECETAKCYQDGQLVKANELSKNPNLVDYVSPTYNFESMRDMLFIDCSGVCADRGYSIYATSEPDIVLNRFTGRKNYIINCLCGNLRE